MGRSVSPYPNNPPLWIKGPKHVFPKSKRWGFFSSDFVEHFGGLDQISAFSKKIRGLRLGAFFCLQRLTGLDNVPTLQLTPTLRLTHIHPVLLCN